MRGLCHLVSALVACAMGCQAGEAADREVYAIEPSDLVAHVDEGDCGSSAELAGERVHRSMREARARWERVPFDGSEASRAIRLARSALACCDLAGLRDEQREASAWLLEWERALHLRVQAERRAFARARAANRPDETAQHATLLLALLEPDNAVTAPLRQFVLRWLRNYQGTAHEQRSS